ncbi:hypothetical protein DICPUDRAFT_150822 [Dictyostelium purpureum]|uniref:Uncharacterized protein n=1 Tax=Dictyostelium purpureum TaxID=5786 RepID=F0ZHC3_DICPU|nr:uncharacterized protein DICPUDRAFT_150822 [Dictyostelium purpureum]EGC36645.1 hypothetical protein DICPUDRAFT_150822 [Dictyostelium purpureum]|eukprot:XP_003286813.1 hypothetical protein DICPUDRAFT_150822 [Dictyostelium purpureum]
MDKLQYSDATPEEIDLIKNSEPSDKLKNIFKAIGGPKSDASSIQVFKNKLIEDAQWRIDVGLDQASPEISTNGDDLVKETIIKDNIKEVYCYINGYFDQPATIKVVRPDSSVPLSNIELLAIYTSAYQWIYKEEESQVGNPGHIEGMLNRDQSHGRYGIYGHDLGDLVYNSFSDISIYSSFIYCEFRVDS